MPSSKNNSKKILEHLYSLKNYGIKPGLTRIKRLLKVLGNPEKDFSSIIVAGTNGKGSVSVMLAEILTTAGYKTGLYTSPHLYKFNERIKIDKKTISTARITGLAKYILALPVVAKDKTTFFELTTAMAYKHFSNSNVDVAVVEVGLGGRFDATNTVNPLVSVVTSVGVDHEKFLGNDIEKICSEKAGVIKKNSDFVTGVRDKKLIRILKKECRENKVKGYYIDKDFKYKKIDCNLKGDYQKDNIAVALEVVRRLREKGFVIKSSHIKKALKTLSWKCRMEVMKTRNGRSVIVDSAHNGAGAKALASSLKKLGSKSNIFVIGIMKDKDMGSIFKELLPIASTVVLTSSRMERSATARELAGYLKDFTGVVEVVPKVSGAVKKAVSLTSKGQNVCVAGSIFTASEARTYIERYMQ